MISVYQMAPSGPLDHVPVVNLWTGQVTHYSSAIAVEAQKQWAAVEVVKIIIIQ